MFAINHTGEGIVCRHGEVGRAGEWPALRYATFMTSETYSRRADGKWERLPGEVLPGILQLAVDAPAWDGTSVTASGWIRPPERNHEARRVALTVGDREVVVVARGERRWVGRGGQLSIGPAAAWTPLRMQWEEAFGGTFDVPAGREERTGFPCPAFVGRHPQNPRGKGFYRSARDAEGKALPRLELLENQLSHFGELPTPGGFAPVPPECVGLSIRLPDSHPLASGSRHSVVAAHHLAPAYQILSWQPPGTRIVSRGFDSDFELVIPDPRVRVRPRRPTRKLRVGTRARLIHVDADSPRATVVWQHAAVTEREELPDLEIVHEGAQP